MLLVIVLNYSSDVKQNINCFVLNLLVLVVKQLVQHSKYLVGSLILLGLGALFLHQLHEGDELVQQSYFDFAYFGGQNVEGHDKTINQESLLDFVCEVHQTLSKI